MGKALVLAEHDGSALSPAVAHAVKAAQAMGVDAVDVLVVGQGVGDVAAEAAKLADVARVRLAEAAHLAAPLAEDVAALLVRIGGEYSHILGAATSFAKNILPRAAALMDVAMISDVIAVLGPKQFKRPIYAGNAIATVESRDAVIIATIRKTAFDAVGSGGSAAVEPLDAGSAVGKSRFVKLETVKSERPELTNAGRVVSGGRAMGSAENFAIITELADKLGAAVGASRAAVDAGYAPNDWQVGQTGKVVAPELYVAVGISGAIQHLAGMKDSKVIVAINKDENAPIFEMADYGLVGDLFDVVPKLTKLL